VVFKAKAYPNQAFSAGPRIAPEDQVKIARALSAPNARTATANLREAYALSGDFQAASKDEYAGIASILKDTWGYR
jgi:hydroxymethylpyrimidine/phosphomethylpyrimidine kinase